MAPRVTALSSPGALIVRRNAIVWSQIGAEQDEIRSARMAVGWKEQSLDPVPNQRIADTPRGRIKPLDTGDVFPVAARLGPVVRPERRVIATREIDDTIDIHPVSNQGGRRGDRRPLAVLGQRGLWLN